jgi:cytidylate kinase
MGEDPIVEEVRKAREAHAAKFHHDLDAIYQDLKAQDERDPRRTVSLPSKRPAPAQGTS